MKRIFSPLLLVAAIGVAGSVAAASITFYQDDNYRGAQFSADRPVSNLAGSNFNDSARSAVVHDGRWEICVDADFGGCSVLEPGAYPNLGAFSGNISSLRPINDGYSANNDRYYNNNRDNPQANYGRDRNARATLYAGPNMSGRSYVLDETMANMGRSGFNDRASSLRVDSGYWIFCSDADFHGECRTYGPGEYPSLPGLNNVISSGRRITNNYPYTDKPDWRRGARYQSQNSTGQ